MQPLVKPETWYRIYWTIMGLGTLGAAYWIIKWAIMAAYFEIRLMESGVTL